MTTAQKSERVTPRPKMNGNQCVCPASGCGKPFPHEQSYRLHYLRAHDENFRASIKKAAKLKKQQTTQMSTASEGPTRKVLDYIFAVLKQHKQPISKHDLLQEIMKAGYKNTTSLNNFGNYVSKLIRQNSSSIVSPDTGQFTLAGGTQSTNSLPTVKTRKKRQSKFQPIQEVEQPPQVQMPLEIEVALLRQRVIQLQEVNMQLVQVVQRMSMS